VTLASVSGFPRLLAKIVLSLGVKGAITYLWHSAVQTPTVVVRPRGYPGRFLCRTGESDILVLWQVFGRRELDIEVRRPARLIVDGGAYTGFSTAYLASRYPEATVVAVEPDPGNFDLLTENTRSFRNVVRLKKALWSQSERLSLLRRPSDLSWAVMVRRPRDEETDGGSVETTTVPEILAMAGADRIDLLKLDIEGAESELFAVGQERWLDRVNVIVVELHSEHAERVVLTATADQFRRSARGEKTILVRGSTPED
jgi:FkbM family methyltransferase